MGVLREVGDLRASRGPLHCALGVFDGLHRGHQEVLRLADAGAAASGGTAVIVSFSPHPIEILRPAFAPIPITPPWQQAKVVEHYFPNFDIAFIPFSKELSHLGGESFLDWLRMEVGSESLKQIAVGKDWVFGKNRSGSFGTLSEWGRNSGVLIEGASIASWDGERISSTRIREQILKGKFDYVESLMGRPFALMGEVVHGQALARTLGFPTANIEIGQTITPPRGVYAVESRLLHGDRADSWMPGVANLGFRPTVANGASALVFEVHLLDSELDLYGQVLETRFCRYIREERKFAGLEALKAQVLSDRDAAQSFFGSR